MFIYLYIQGLGYTKYSTLTKIYEYSYLYQLKIMRIMYLYFLTLDKFHIS